VTDLGTDEVSKYSPNKNSVLEKAILLAYKSKAGNGPRHLAFGKTADIVYVLNELSNTIDVLRNKNGKLNLVHTCSVLPDTVTTTPTAADIHVSDDKKFLYSSIRGEVNAIGVFSLANPTKPVLVQHIKSGGWTPRNFVIHPSGKYLLVAHQNSNNIVVFKRDAKNGMLTTTNEFLNIGKPVCLKWLSDK
jgi:6-phosphogluconolactonase